MARVTPWTDPGLPETVEYDSDELELVRRRAVDGLLSLPRVGAGVGGLLLGTQRSGLIRILGSRELACSHAFGPGFRLTEEEIAAAFGTRLDPAALHVVGWYCSKPRGKAELTEEDRKLFKALCPLLSQIALLIVPSTVDATHAAVFMRKGGGEFAGGMLLPLPARETGTVAEPERPAAASLIDEIALARPPLRLPDPPHPAPAQSVPLFAVPPTRRWLFGLPRWAAAATLCAFAAWSVFASRNLWWPHPKLDLRSFDSGDALTIEWNSAAVRGIGAGSLEIRDGSELRTYPMNAAQLRAGTIKYLRKTGKISAHLRAGRIEEIVTFTGPPAATKR